MPSGSALDSASGQLGRFVAGCRFEDLPANVRQETKRSILNFLGGALGVAHDPAIEMAAKVLAPLSGLATATVIGRRERMDALSASFLNAISSNLLDYDDTHLATVIHPAAPVAPPVLALAEQRGFTGADVMLAFALGGEVECRIGNAVSPGHYARGWHITSTCGVFGAAAAAARLLGLPAAQTGHALGIAASQSAGLVENLPSAAKNVGVGNAARNGLFAALLAEAGYEAAPAAIEGPLGWARAAGDTPKLDEIAGELGQRWEIAKNTYKPYPAGIVFHSVIDASLELRAKYGLSGDQIRDVVVRGSSLLLARGDRVVRNERDARVSIHHSVATAMLWNAAGVAEFAEPKAMSAEAVAFRQKVRALGDDTMPVGAAEVFVTTTGGAEHRATVVHPRGSFEKPLSDKDIEAKVRDLAAMAPFRCDIGRVIDDIWNLDRLASVSGTLRALARPA